MQKYQLMEQNLLSNKLPPTIVSLSHHLPPPFIHVILCEQAMGHWATTKHYIFLFLKATHSYHFFIIIHSSTPKNSLHLSQHLLQ